MIGILWLVLPLLAAAGFWTGRSRARALSAADADGHRIVLHSLPTHYAQYALAWSAIPPLLILVVSALFGSILVDGWVTAQLEASGLLRETLSSADVLRDVHTGLANTTGEHSSPPHAFAQNVLDRARGVLNLGVTGFFFVAAGGGLWFARSRMTTELRARNHVERIVHVALFLCSVVAVLTTIGIVVSLFFEAARFFALVSPVEFFLGTQWSPQTALRADQVGSSGAFGAVPIFAGTLLITAIAMAISGPIGLMAAIHLAFYASASARAWMKPVLELIAGIPTVVWGSFAALTLGPQVRMIGDALGLEVASESALAAGLAMGVMIIPFVSSLSDDALNAVPRSLREASLAMGATESETIRKVMVPAALPGIVGAFLLAVSRAIGETMIVVMAAGLAANMTANPFAAVTTVTVQILTLLVGDQEFDSAKTLAAFALGLTLFFVTLCLNLVALIVVRRFREEYE